MAANSIEQPPKPRRRGPGRPFQPGQSGNPSGRPKLIGAMRDLAREHTWAAFRQLAREMSEGDSSMARIAAARELLDRGWGKPTQPILENLTITADDDPRDVIAQQLARIAAAGTATADIGGTDPGTMH